MGQKINPFIFRVILNRNWNSSWFSKDNLFSKNLLEDFYIRKIIFNYFGKNFFGKIIIQKSSSLINILVYVESKDILLKSGINILDLKNLIKNIVCKDIYINFINIENPGTNLELIFFKLKDKIIYRKSYKILIKNIFHDFFISKGIGIKILIKGRLNGSIMSKKQVFKQGRLPLQRISSNIKYYSNFIRTVYGVIGVKIWSYMGDFFYV